MRFYVCVAIGAVLGSIAYNGFLILSKPHEACRLRLVLTGGNLYEWPLNCALSLRRPPVPDSPEALAEARDDTVEPVSPSPPRVEAWAGPSLTTGHDNIAIGVAAASAMTCIGWEACGPLPAVGETPGTAEPGEGGK